MQERIDREIAMLRTRWPGTEYRPEGQWVRIPDYPLPPDWNRTATDVAFQILVGHPGTPPYGFYVPVGITVKGQKPDNYVEPASTLPPFGGSWGIFSWAPVDGEWRATADPATGSNLLTWALGLGHRFREGK